jgi:hypothetical protein
VEPRAGLGPMSTGSFVLDAIVYGFMVGFVVALVG